MEAKTTAEQMRDKVEKLFRDAGYPVPELLEYIENMELQQARMSEELKKWRQAAARRSPSAASMNSKLKDALRE